MATSGKTMGDSFPVPVYNYRVVIGGETHSFSEVSGLSINIEPITYKHGLSFLEGVDQSPGMRSEIKLTLKRGILKKRSYLLNWILPSVRGKADKRNLSIDLCDETGTPIISWKVHNAFPVKMDAPSFTATANEVAVESVELLANYLEIDYHN